MYQKWLRVRKLLQTELPGIEMHEENVGLLGGRAGPSFIAAGPILPKCQDAMHLSASAAPPFTQGAKQPLALTQLAGKSQ